MRGCFYCILFVSFFIPVLVSAQDKQARIKGTVTDTARQTLSYATISLFKPGELKEAVKTTYSGKKGEFELTADTGSYILTVSHVSLSLVSIKVSIRPGDNFLDSIVLSSVPRLMQNITITVRKPLIEQSDDKLTYNVESDPAAKSESATDLLRKTPLVTVDGEGNVQLNGQSNFKILLNGRETSMFAQNVKEALKNFPGAVISKIEVITSPSAKYDAEGVGGIINIITKKKVIGYNGYLSSYYSTLSNYSEGLSLNVKSGKVGISTYMGASGTAHPVRSEGISVTTPVGTALYSKRSLDGERKNASHGLYGNLELTYDIDSFQTIAAYGNIGGYSSEGSLSQSIITEYGSQPTENSLLIQGNDNSNPNSGFGTDFIRHFRNRPEKELSFRFNGQFSKNSQELNSAQDNPGQDRYVYNQSISTNHEYTVQADLVQPLRAKQKLETGAKAILRSASSDFSSYIKHGSSDPFLPNPSNSDRFNYHQEVYSLYGSYSGSLKKYTVRGGLRMEYTNVDGNFASSATTVHQGYGNLVPNILVSRKFTSVYSFTGTYNMRLQRPYIGNLNPFVNNTDSLNISFGNPNLGPQVLHVVSVQNRFVKGKAFASVNLNASYTKSQIVQFVQFNAATGVTSTTSANVGRETQFSIGFNINTPIGDKINAGLFSQLRYNHIENKSDILQNNGGISGVAAGNFNYKVVGTFTISGSGGLARSPYNLVGSPPVTYFYQVNFGYKFFKEKLSVTMNVNNFHRNYMRYETITERPDFTIVSSNRSPYRVIYFGATYNFGKLKEAVSKKKGVTNDDLLQ
jgi:outer membrane receptor protein involved in Fe transport